MRQRKSPGPTDDETKLRKLVRERCLAEYARLVGHAWPSALFAERAPARRIDRDVEASARRVLVQLRAALNAAHALAEQAQKMPARRRGEVTDAFAEHAPNAIASLLGEEWIASQPKPDDPREVIVWHAEMTPALFPRDRWCTARELAIVSLLAGNWPTLRDGAASETVASVIEAETKAIRQAAKRCGYPVAPANRTDTAE